MKITNPTDSDISVGIKGGQYTVKANGSLSNVPADVAEYWKTMLHHFIVVSRDDTEVDVEIVKEKTTKEVDKEPEVVAKGAEKEDKKSSKDAK